MNKKQIEKKAKEIANQWQEPSDYNIARDAATEMGEWLLSHQWVRVEDELPPLEKKVLVKHKYGFQTAARFPYYDIRPDETFWGLNSKMPIGADITHWMPIPPLAEEGGEKK